MKRAARRRSECRFLSVAAFPVPFFSVPRARAMAGFFAFKRTQITAAEALCGVCRRAGNARFDDAWRAARKRYAAASRSAPSCAGCRLQRRFCPLRGSMAQDWGATCAPLHTESARVKIEAARNFSCGINALQLQSRFDQGRARKINACTRRRTRRACTSAHASRAHPECTVGPAPRSNRRRFSWCGFGVLSSFFLNADAARF